MRKILFLAVALLLLGAVPVSAQEIIEVMSEGGTLTVTTEENVVTSDETPVLTEDNEVLSETVSVPGAFGLFWRNIRERVSIALTFNTVKKAEKQLQYAEERMQIAEAVAVQAVSNPQLQDKAEKIMERANQLMEKVQERQELFNNSEDTRVRALLRNTATQMVQREAVLNKIETILSPERLQKFETTRIKNIENSQRLLNALNNEKIPEEIQIHLQEVKQRIEEHSQEVKQFQEEKKELLDKAAVGIEEAKLQLKELNRERVEIRKEQQIEQKQLRQEVKDNIKEMKQELSDQAVEDSAGAATQLQEIKQQNVQQNRIENSNKVGQ